MSSEYLIRDGTGQEYKPEDYLDSLRPVRPARTRTRSRPFGILLDRPQGWSTAALVELQQKLASAPERFTVETLQKAHQALLRQGRWWTSSAWSSTPRGTRSRC